MFECHFVFPFLNRCGIAPPQGVFVFLPNAAKPREFFAVFVFQLDEAAAIDARDAAVDADVFLDHESFVVIIVFGNPTHPAIQRVWIGWDEFEPQLLDVPFEFVLF